MTVKNLRIVDYKGDWEDFVVDMEEVLDIYLMILSGDEILRVHRKNGNEEIIDTHEFDRIESIYQGGYRIYDSSNPDSTLDITNQPEWLNRKSSDDYLATLYEMSRNAENKVRH